MLRQHHEGLEREDLLAIYQQESSNLDTQIGDIQHEKAELEGQLREIAQALSQRADRISS